MYKHLTQAQRYAIYLGLKEGRSQSSIAKMIEVSPSTVSREIRRNQNRFGHYFWEIAHKKYRERQERLPGNHSLKPYVLKEALSLLCEEQWSPRQISGYLSIKGIRISHESIYKRIRADQSGALREHCRHKLKHRHRTIYGSCHYIPDRVGIQDRPSEADGKRFGDWEMDLILGEGQHSAILTLCERSVNYMMMTKLPLGKNADGVAEAVMRLLMPYRGYVKSITTDNGREFSKHKDVAKFLGTTVYFADPYSAWQKGAIENMNMLVRQYIPKGIDFKSLSEEYVHSVQLKLNRRPREKLGFSTPKREFFNRLC